ncbi:hypothetical protein DFQ27_008856 [Actinomortierella ambigua]|uniref:Uncharacterized protein n=1 Tax=Actinomortierella ambigua TaxID=1343610 RepID=A0A9P6PR87_9FUNG|nr:hypothetical protein DFQ27_008856 [Actinomortierella ambigua]
MLSSVTTNLLSNHLPTILKWLSHVSVWTFGTYAMAIAEYSNIEVECNADEIRLNMCPARHGKEVLEFARLDKYSLGECLAYVCLLMVLYRMGQANSTPASPNSGSQYSQPSSSSSSPSSTSTPPPPSSSSMPPLGGDVTPIGGNPVGGSSHLPHLPSVEDLRNMTHRILASSSDKLRQLRENMPKAEVPKLDSSSNVPSNGALADKSSSAPSAASLSSLSEAPPPPSLFGGKALDQRSQELLEDQAARMTTSNQAVFVFKPPSPPTTIQPTTTTGNSSSSSSSGVSNMDNSSNILSKKDQSLKEVIKIHYQLSASWIKRNASTIAIVGFVAVVGIVALRAARANHQKRRQERVVRGLGGAKREIVVITSVATLEGVTLALALEQQGFIVFVGVPDRVKADEVNAWGRHDIHPLVLDPSKPHVVDEFVNAITHFLDLRNGELLGLGLPMAAPAASGAGTGFSGTFAPSPLAASTSHWNNDHTRDHSGSFLVQEELSMSTANIHFLQPTPPPAAPSSSTSPLTDHQNSNNRIGLYPSLAHHTDVVVQRERRATTADQGAPVFRLAAIVVQPPETVVVGAIEHVDLELWRRAFDVNVMGSIVVLQKFMPLLRRTLALPSPRRSPRVLLLSSSVTGNLGLPHQSVLSASHHAIESLADSLRREVQHQGIDVVCLKPGVIESSERKELKYKQQQNKMAAGKVGLFSSFDWSNKAFTRASTTVALQHAVYDAVTMKRPPAQQAMGSGSAAYAFVAWAVPRAWVDWAIRRNPPQIVHRTVKVTNTPPNNNSQFSATQHEE